MTWLTSVQFWSDVLQWLLIGYLCTRTQKKPRRDDLGSVPITKDRLPQNPF